MNPILTRPLVPLLFLAVALLIPAELLAQESGLSSRPGSKKPAATSEQLQVNARRPGKSQSATAAAKTSNIAPASHETVLADELIDEGAILYDDTVLYDDAGLAETEYAPGACNCPACNPIAHLTCTTFGCGCGGRAPGCGIWISAEYLLWSLEGMDLPAIVTTSPVGTASADIGVLGLASTSTLFEGTVGEDFRSGGRVTVGIWTDPARQLSWEASYLGFDSGGEDFAVASTNTPNLARPVFDTLIGAEASLLIAQSNLLSGSVAVATSTELQSFEILRRQRLCSDGYFNFDLLLGFKHGSLEDMVRLNQSSNYLMAQGPILAGTNINAFDHFEAENRFNGVLLGLERRHRWNCWLIGYTGKLSIGANESTVLIDGRTVTAVPGAGGSTFNGGLLAQPTNIGIYKQDEAIVIPEFAFTLKRQLNQCARLQCGYSLMYWSTATRASDAVSRRVSQFPPEPVSGTAEPQFIWNSNGFLAHGFQFGLDYRF